MSISAPTRPARNNAEYLNGAWHVFAPPTAAQLRELTRVRAPRYAATPGQLKALAGIRAPSTITMPNGEQYVFKAPTAKQLRELQNIRPPERYSGGVLYRVAPATTRQLAELNAIRVPHTVVMHGETFLPAPATNRQLRELMRSRVPTHKVNLGTARPRRYNFKPRRK